MRSRSRRDFLKSSVTAACAATVSTTALAESVVAAAHTTPSRSGGSASPGPLSIKKGVWFGMLPEKLNIADRYKLARDVGFEVVQAPTEPDEHKAEEVKKAADAAGIRIDSVMNMDHWKYPLSSSHSAVVEKSLTGMRASLHNAKLWGCDAVLLRLHIRMPGRVRKRRSVSSCLSPKN